MSEDLRFDMTGADYDLYTEQLSFCGKIYHSANVNMQMQMQSGKFFHNNSHECKNKVDTVSHDQ